MVAGTRGGQLGDLSKRSADLFFASMAGDRELREDELAPFRDSARERAAEGHPLEDLLQAHRLAARAGWEALVEAARPDELRGLLPSVGRLMKHIDRVSDAITESYHELRRQVASEEERRARDVFRALASDAPDVPVLDEYVALVLALRGGAAEDRDRVMAELRHGGVVAVAEDERILGLLPPGTDQPAIAPGALYAVSDPVRRRDLPAVLADLRSLVELGLRMGRTGRMELEDHLPELLLSRSPGLGERLRRRALGPLEDYAARRRANLIETLETFVACDLDRRNAAERLKVHPNTLDYRLRRVEELTGLKLGRASDMVLICLALKQRMATT